MLGPMIIGFAGSGNMVAAMARGWAKAERQPDGMLFSDAGSGRAATLAAEVGGEAVASNRDLAARADLVILGFKPKDLESAAADLAAAPAVLSLLNATSLERVQTAFPDSEAFRLMPNLGVENNRGVMGLVVPEGSARGQQLAELLEALGTVFRLDDSQIDGLTALAGCTPAYFDLFVDSLAEPGAAAGLDPEAARAMVIETMAGTVDLLRQRGPGELRRQVASPGGSTEAGLEALARADFPGVVKAGVEASLARMRGEI
jgi:pyrroline-5-carboxylate reductase